MISIENEREPTVNSTLCALRSTCSLLCLALDRIAEDPPHGSDLIEAFEGIGAVSAMMKRSIEELE